MENVNKKVKSLVRALAAEISTKFEKKKKINVRELIISLRIST